MVVLVVVVVMVMVMVVVVVMVRAGVVGSSYLLGSAWQWVSAG